MKLSKVKIEEMANEIIDYLKKNELDDGVCIYFNNKRICLGSEWNSETREFIPYEKVEENINPLDYFEYANESHILSMSFEGGLYGVINYGNTDKLDAIFEKYGLYYELGNSWNLTAFPSTIDYDDIEYTPYEREPDPEFIYLRREDVLPELKNIMVTWYELSKMSGDGGSCVLGAGFNFKYKGNPYKMGACSPWQGSLSWEEHIGTVKEMLLNIGATEIHYDYGRMD
jgi:hypothetical protein